mmetsp:Transcript_59066/g.93484  ORF Transcript_59066/g.93484 Transcript_59066/m.93484 type:complete len:201 (+) Transcript_59066:1804-2406(+)
MQEPNEEDRSGCIVTEVLHRRKGTSCPQQKGRQGCDLRQGNGDAHALDGFLHPLRKAQRWIRGIEGATNHESIIDADAHQNEWQDLLQHCEGDSEKHGSSVARDTSEEHQVEFHGPQQPSALGPAGSFPKENRTESGHQDKCHCEQGNVGLNGSIQLIILRSLGIHKDIHRGIALFAQLIVSEELRHGEFPRLHFLSTLV